MKRFLILLLALPFLAQGQAPQKLNYQSIVRDGGGTPIIDQNVSFRMSILESSITGTEVFVESHQVTTNQYGSVNFHIGTGQVEQGVFSEIDWGGDSHFLKTEMDLSGGSNYMAMGTSELVSVPYALYANEAKTSRDGKTFLNFYGDITDNEAVQKIQQESGPNTQIVQAYFTSQLTNIEIQDFEEVYSILIANNDVLTEFSMPDLKFISQRYIGAANIEYNPQLDDLNLSGLEFVQGRLDISANALTSLTLNSLIYADNLIIREPLLVSIDLPNLVDCRNIYINDNPNLTAMNIPLVDFSHCTGTIRFHSNAFSSSTVNELLSRMVADGVTDLSIELENQTPPAPPTGQGLIDKQTLIDNGNTVTTD